MPRTLLLLTMSSLAVFAQAPTAEITGSVTDPTGAAVIGSKITLTRPSNNLRRSVTSNDAGIYGFPALAPGVYDLRVEAPGFSSEVRNGVELQVGQVARLDFPLKVGNVSEVIEVAGGAPVLETDTASLGAVIENRRIVELPLNGRNYLQLVSLTPGATTNSPASSVAQLRMGGARTSFTVSVSGQRIAFNRYTLDGIENTDVNFASYLVLPSIDALQEFKVESGVFGAEYGRATSQINVTTKSGANQLHGTFFEFLRNSQLDAKNFFDRPNLPIPPFKRNQFGFTVSGPVIIPKLFHGKDRLFFMLNYEGLRERKGLTQTATVPLLAQDRGDFSALSRPVFDPASRVFDAAGQVTAATAFPGNVIPTARLSSESRSHVPSKDVPRPQRSPARTPGSSSTTRGAPRMRTSSPRESISSRAPPAVGFSATAAIKMTATCRRSFRSRAMVSTCWYIRACSPIPVYSARTRSTRRALASFTCRRPTSRLTPSRTTSWAH